MMKLTAGEGETVGDLQPGVRHETQESSLSNPTATGAGLQLVAMLYQLHDHQAVYLDNLGGTLQVKIITAKSTSIPQYWSHSPCSYESFRESQTSSNNQSR